MAQLLNIYFSVAHDPTELNRQGPDEGTQYRSEIFYTNDEQKRVAEAYIHQLDAAKVFHGRIVTKVAPLQAFYRAEDYHQHYRQSTIRISLSRLQRPAEAHQPARASFPRSASEVNNDENNRS